MLIRLIVCSIIMLAGCSSKSKKVVPPPVAEHGKITMISALEGTFKFRANDFLNLKTEQLPPQTQVSEFKAAGWKVTHIFFGYVTDHSENADFVAAGVVPFEKGRLYGWAVRFEEVEIGLRPLTIIETLTLPDVPQTFRYDSNQTTLDKKGQVATTKLRVDPKEQWVYNFWQITEEDPKGSYEIELMIHGKPFRKLQFKIADAEISR